MSLGETRHCREGLGTTGRAHALPEREVALSERDWALLGQAGYCRHRPGTARRMGTGPDTAGRDRTLLGGTGHCWE